jgi:hypothetical protein
LLKAILFFANTLTRNAKKEVHVVKQCKKRSEIVLNSDQNQYSALKAKEIPWSTMQC